jgi:hemerythrin-like domain-containing protein
MIQSNPGPQQRSPIDELAAAHEDLERRLVELEGVARQLTPSVSPDVVMWMCQRLGELEREGLLHALDEEESLFPRIRNKVSPDAAAHLEVLSQQHREAQELFPTLSSLLELIKTSTSEEQRSHAIARLDGYLEPFAEHYRFHIGFEEKEVLGLAKRVLTDTELAEISEEMRKRRARTGPRV